jgi:hypothetical protein
MQNDRDAEGDWQQGFVVSSVKVGWPRVSEEGIMVMALMSLPNVGGAKKGSDSER